MAGGTTGSGSGSSGRTVERAFAGGLTTFAGIMLIFGGIMAVFQGISGIAHDDLVVVTKDYTFSMNTTGWGWIDLVLGVVLVLAGTALVGGGGAVWARVVGVIASGLAMIANFVWLPHYPFWAVVLIAINAFVIWALCVGTTRRLS
ncbi:hypothetical protein [Kitasatospora sp. NPDC096140]|uniref:DUF7144 family membrane protein n=1 Tax=Kitasatospora sp. NPDC096140 TaxID=3155425 RepID=UPI003324CCBD